MSKMKKDIIASKGKASCRFLVKEPSGRWLVLAMSHMCCLRGIIFLT